MDNGDGGNTQERWARLRFAVVGLLLGVRQGRECRTATCPRDPGHSPMFAGR